VCRSPYVERLVAAELRSSERYDISVTSRGVEAMVGAPIDRQMLRVLTAENIDALGFASRQLTAADVESATLVLTASRDQRRTVTRLVPAALDRTFTLAQLERLLGGLQDAQVAVGPSLPELVRLAAGARGVWEPSRRHRDDIPDPHGGSDAAYRQAARRLRASTGTLLRMLAAP
jgi:protein-tyrosine phosphatase